MGTDIHIYVEGYKKGKWEHLENVKVDQERDYDFFGTLCGVRRDRNLYIEDTPRGFPEDVSESVKKRYHDDYYYQTYYFRKELKKFYKRLKDYGSWKKLLDKRDELHMESWRKPLIMRYKELLKELKIAKYSYGVEKIRIVFWFDS